MFMTKLFFQRCVLSSFIFLSFNIFADSPLTSISFWDISQSALVQKTGKQKGKKKLNNVSFKFLTDFTTPIFDKIALVNAMGWDSNSKFKNSEIFLNKLKKNTPPYDGVDSLWKLEDNIIHSYHKGFGVEDNYIVYLYLLAMDNYWDVSLVFDVLDYLNGLEYLLPNNEEYGSEGEVIGFNYNNIDSKEACNFIKMLVSTQYLLLTKGIDCEVWEEFDKISGRVDYSCMSNLSIRKSLLKSYDYLKSYSNNCEEVWYDFSSYYFRNVIHATQNQQVIILHNPLFIYGELTIYDQNNNEVFKFIIDGDDYVALDISNYPLGSYRIQMMNTETVPITTYDLELIIY